MSRLREIVRLAAPMLVAQLAVMANAVADTVLTGHYDPTHLAAVGLGASVYFTIFVAFNGALQALSPLIARRFGAGHHHGIGVLLRQGVLISAVMAVPGIALLAHPWLLLPYIDAPPDVSRLLARYLEAVAIGLPAVLLTRVYLSLAPAVGHARSVMLLNLVSLSLKVPLTWALIHGAGPFPELGGPGCGVASSVVAWIVAGVALARMGWGRPYARFAFFGGSFAPDWRILREILHLGIPIGLTFLVDVTAYTFMALFLAPLGPTVSGAHQIAANLGAVMFMVPLSLGAGTQILAGHALGAGDPQRARSFAVTGLRLGFAVALVLAATLMLARHAVVALYTSDPAVAALAASLLPLLALYHLGDSLQGVAAQVLRAYHRAVLPMVAFIVTMWGFGLGAGWWLAFRGPTLGTLATGGADAGPLGAAGFWIAEAVGVTLLGIVLAAYLLAVARSEPRRAVAGARAH